MNANQLAAVQHRNGACCVLASAGSGKTAVLVRRIQTLIESGVPAQRILAVTFSKKAVAEMKVRIQRQIGGVPITVCTFHSLGYNVLKTETNGYVSGKDPIREYAKIAFIKEMIKGSVLEEQDAAPKHISSFIGVLKSNLRKPHERPPDCAQIPALNELYNVFAKYETHKQTNGLYDFDDMGDMPVYRLRDNPHLLGRIRSRWDYILVDEYQDTNPAQDELLRLIAPAGDNIFVVGDDYQAIYSFRGADVNNILNFPKRYPGARMIYLDVNYRSTPEIVEASNSLIQGNKNQFQKNVVSGRESLGKKPTFITYANEYAEAKGISKKIRRMHDAGCPYSSIAILYRANSVSRAIEEALLSQQIPFSVQGGTRFFEQQYVADIVDYLRLALNLEDSKALLRILNRPNRFFGQEFRAEVEECMAENRATAWKALRFNRLSKEWRYRKNVDAFATQLLWLSKHAAGDIGKLLDYVLDVIGYRECLKTDSSEDRYEERMESVEELCALTDRFGKASDFVAYVDVQLRAYEQNANRLDAVTLSTVHKAKGLEYPTVFVATCIDGMFPHKDAPNREEERRILYVAMTRAIDNLEMSSIEARRDNAAYVSPFLESIGDMLKVENAPSVRGHSLIPTNDKNK